MIPDSDDFASRRQNLKGSHWAAGPGHGRSTESRVPVQAPGTPGEGTLGKKKNNNPLGTRERMCGNPSLGTYHRELIVGKRRHSTR